MQSRVKQMEKRISKEIEEKEGLLADLERSVDLKLMPLSHHKDTLVRLKDYSLTYVDAKHPVLSNLTFSLHQGERIAFHGENGCGKSTLLQMILEKAGLRDGKMPLAEEGICETASGLVISQVPQDTSGLGGGLLDFSKKQGLDLSLLFSILRQLDFERAQFSKPMEEYSEGQKKKVLLAASLLTPAHLYLWDEPLNYIDIFSRMQIEKLLLQYQPTMLFVEHDIRFQEKIATRTIDLQR